MAPEPPGEQELTPDQIEKLVRVIEAARRRQRIMLLGYSLALLVFIVGVLAAFYAFGKLPDHTFRGWVFLAPPGLAGTILWIFGWLAKKKVPPIEV
jgi:hypothetical protein